MKYLLRIIVSITLLLPMLLAWFIWDPISFIRTKAPLKQELETWKEWILE